MPFSHLTGNERVKGALQHMLDSGRLGQSLLFAGPEGVGKGLFAQAFAEQVLCPGGPSASDRSRFAAGNHPDLHVLKPEGKLGLHSIDSLRQFCEEVYLYPYEAKKKVFILHDADRMAPAGANALLKTFEEPAPDALIILVSSHPAALLDTILSRCLKVYFRAVSETDIHALLSQRNVTDAQARLFSRLAGGSVRQALQWAEEGLDPGRATLLEALGRGALASYTDVVALSAGLADALDKRRKNLEGEWRRELLAAYPDPKAVTALQRHAMEKEVEGALATHYAGEVQQLLDVLLSWYRDLTYLKEGGTVEGVLNLDCADALKRWVDKGWPVHGLEEVQAAVADLQRALARSSPLAPQLEGLFLRLGLC